MNAPSSWAARYQALIERLPELAARSRLTMGGFSVCTDVYLSLSASIERLRAATGANDKERDVVNELERRARCGIGGELAVEWPEGAAWVDAHVSGRRGVGGTNLQAAQMLAMLGAPAVSSLEDRSEGQLAVIHPEVLVAEADGLAKRAMVKPIGTGRAPHYVFEYTAGESIGGSIVPRSSRIILRFDHSELQHDAAFDHLSVELAGSAGAGIICGFNEVSPDMVAAELDYAAGLARAWRDAGLALVHLELGGYATAEARLLTLTKMLPAVTSLGMSLSEFRDVVPDAPAPDEAVIELATAYGLDRVCVHADGWAFSATRNDPERELEALAVGCLLASTRAAAGDFAVPYRLPDNALFETPPLPASRRHDGWSVVCCPAPYLERPRATIGLGDTFLAGTLLVLGGAATPPGDTHNPQRRLQ